MTPQEAADKYHWIKYDARTNTIEMYCDHHMLSTLRTCEAKFELEHLLNIRPAYRGQASRSWSLEHGSYLHHCLEIFYNSLKEGKVIPLSDWLEKCKGLWEYYKLDDFSSTDKYKEMKGWPGSAGMWIMYYTYYENIRLRVVGTEIVFGYDKEVFLGEFKLPWVWTDPPYSGGEIKIKCYLTGRIDLVVDNGYKIGPIDHKHSHKFRGDEWLKWNPHDGITGYILACGEVLKKVSPQYFENGRQCLSAWMFHLSSCMVTPRDTSKEYHRFKATPIDKTPSQLEEYKKRQVSTFEAIAGLLFNNRESQWNNHSCHSFFGRDCEYKLIHEAPSNEWQNIIGSHYHVTKPWDPAKITEDNLIQINKLNENTDDKR